MKMNKIIKWTLCFLFNVFIVVAQAQNPILPPNVYFADPSAKVFPDGKLYIYGSLDEVDGQWCSTTHHVVSTSDMIHWDLSKNVFSSVGSNDEVPYNDALLFAPDCQYKDGKYYMYYCQPADHAEGVAIGNSPIGPFKGGKALNVGKHQQIDPCVFIDYDGQAYYVWGQFSMKMAKLNADMVSLDESTIIDNVLTEKEHHFHEGSFMTKRNNIYYLVFADISRAGIPSCLGYATSSKPMGPYTYRGVIIDNDHCDPGCWNNHGSIAEFKNQWYVFYHRNSQESKMMRRMCVEPISFNADGSIPEVEMTSQGAGASLNAFETIDAYRACSFFGRVRLILDGDGAAIMTKVRNQDKAAFKYVDFGNGEAKTVRFLVRPGEKPGVISVVTDKTDQPAIAVVQVPACNQDNKWITVTADVRKVKGKQGVWLSFKGDGDDLFEVKNFVFLILSF